MESVGIMQELTTATSSIRLLRSATADVIGDTDATTVVDQTEGASSEEEEEASNVGVAVELADCLGDHGSVELAFLGEVAYLGELAGVAGRAGPEADAVHHVIPV
ncbi:hypothetical protein ACLOJK_026540 [Asimina triloba]